MMKRTTTSMSPKLDPELYAARNRSEAARAVLIEFNVDARSESLPMVAQQNWLTPDGKMLSGVLDIARMEDLAKLVSVTYVQAKRTSQPNLGPTPAGLDEGSLPRVP